MKRLIALCMLCSSCAAPTFFGAQLDGPYHYHYGNQLQCAWVKGWSDHSACMCVIVDKNFSINKSFLASEPVFCDKNVGQ